MENDKGFIKVLKWVGIVALVAVPLAVFLKKRKPAESMSRVEDESDIFASELEE